MRASDCHGATLVKDFGPLALPAIQRRLADLDKCRRYVNDLIEAIKRIFRWSVAQDLVPEAIYRALTAAAGLQKGPTLVQRTAPVRPVADDAVESPLPYVPVVIAPTAAAQHTTDASIHPTDPPRSGGRPSLPSKVNRSSWEDLRRKDRGSRCRVDRRWLSGGLPR